MLGALVAAFVGQRCVRPSFTLAVSLEHRLARSISQATQDLFAQSTGIGEGSALWFWGVVSLPKASFVARAGIIGRRVMTCRTLGAGIAVGGVRAI